MRFVDFLKTTVLLSAAAATLLGTLTVLGATREVDPLPVYVSAVWWTLAAFYGAYLGRQGETNPPITRLLAEARSATTLPELRPAVTLLNRLWSLLLFVLLAGIVGSFVPPVAGIATGFAIIWPLSIRRQERAVAAIEERDAVRFYVDQTSPFKPTKLIRTPGFGGNFLAIRPG
ncbi:MAG: hypothetical protein H0V22_02825 [Solirubrobacterales bacterium]|nr:hypothetical protein [Solirubrobacterales bacterium]